MSWPMMAERGADSYQRIYVFGDFIMAALWQWLTANSNIWLSKTLWFNAVTFALAIAGHASGVVPPEWQPYVAMFIAIGNFALRFLVNPSPVPGPVPDVPPSPATDLLALIQKVIEALIAQKVKPGEVKQDLLAKVSAAVDEAAVFADTDPDKETLLKELKA